ncbi:MAG: helix-turn-helix domain-containing protein [Planctomycetaceae bacterium]|nr:helix-turn-helix domain-containing protein [Planctomycetaceae bacterium]
MFDNIGIYNRYESCYGVGSSGELAHILGIARQTTNDWKNGKSKVPWWRLKELVDIQRISWDWLLTGVGNKHHSGESKAKTTPFDTKGINNRFLDLYPKSPSQVELARQFKVSQVTIHKWRHAQVQIPWKKLAKGVEDFDTSWEWILEGRK